MSAYNLSKSYRRKALDQLTGQTGNTPGSTLGGPQTTAVPGANGAAMQGGDYRNGGINPAAGGIEKLPAYDSSFGAARTDEARLQAVRQMLEDGKALLTSGPAMREQLLNIDPSRVRYANIGGASAAADASTPPAGSAQSADPAAAAGSGAGSGYDVGTAYDDIMRALKGSADASFANTQQQLYSQAPGINQNYDTLNSQAYANARLSALGNNEALASQGLAGAASAGPQSGYTESSRVAQDAALGNAVNSNNLARRNALDALTGQVNQAQTARDASVLNTQGQVLQQKASAMQNQDQFNRNLALQQLTADRQNEIDLANLTGLYNGKSTFAAQQAAIQNAMAEAGITGSYGGADTLAKQQLTAQLDQQKIDNAMNRINLMGYVDAEAAAATGLPVNTPSWQANQWKQEFDYTKQQNARRSSVKAPAVMPDNDIADTYDAASSLPTVAQLQQMGMPQYAIDAMKQQGRVRG